MNTDNVKRLVYYQGQVLTAKDFNDQQEYHREKLRLLTARFPFGIVSGLEVVFSPPNLADPKDYEAIKIERGLAMDADGNAIVVPEIRIDVAEFEKHPDRCYLSVMYGQESVCVGSGCEGSAKYNRIIETAEPVWDSAPNAGDGVRSHVTVARIRKKNVGPDPAWEKAPAKKKSAKGLLILDENEKGNPAIRRSAAVVGEEQIAENAISEKLIRKDAITSEKIRKGSVTPDKLDENVRTLGLQSVKTDDLDREAVTSLKIGKLQVEERHVQANAVTPEKLSVVVIKASGTVEGMEDDIHEVRFSDDRFRVPNVVPTEFGKLTWTFDIERTKEDIIYHFKIRNVNAEKTTDTLKYRIDFAQLNDMPLIK